MEYKVNYTIVGLFVLCLFSLLLTAGFWLSDSDHRHQYEDYVVYMNESVNGLSEQAPVKFNGVNIGYVKDISLNPNNLQQVKLLLKIEEGIPITKSTVASLKAQGVTGITYIGLESKRVKSALLVAKEGEPYPVIESQPSLLIQLGDTIRDVSTNLSGLSKDLQEVFDAENRQSLKMTLKNLSIFSEQLAKNSVRLETTLNSADLLLANSTNTMRRLESISVNVEKFSQDVQRNPSVILRGKTNAASGPGE